MVTMQNNRSTQIDDKYSNRRERLAGWNHYMIVDSFQLSKVLWAFSIVSSHVLIYNYWINFTYCWDDSCLSQFSILSNTLLISEWRKSLLPHQMLQVPSPKNLWSFSLKLYSQDITNWGGKKMRERGEVYKLHNFQITFHATLLSLDVWFVTYFSLLVFVSGEW